MGEHAEDYFRKEMRDKYGFDPGEGSLYDDATRQPRENPKPVVCKVCSKRFAKRQFMEQHQRDKHGLDKE